MTVTAMDPDQIHSMAIIANQIAKSMQEHMSQLVTAVRGAEWQSQAREESINNLEDLIKVSTKPIQAVCRTVRTAEHEADQWKVFANKLSRSFHHLDGISNSFFLI
jgi:uncharacterized protein Yka (UPF0111/DUF47 family)